MDFGIFTIVSMWVLVHPIGQKDKSSFFFSFLLVGVCVGKKIGFALLMMKLWDPSHVKGKNIWSNFQCEGHP
jgi:hypothetical protein